MSFYTKLAQLPDDQQERWETFLLQSYSLQEASRLLDYLIEADRWLPLIFDNVRATCRELKVARLPEAVEQLGAVNMQFDGPFLQAILSEHGSRFGVFYRPAFALEIAGVLLAEDRQRWIAKASVLLEKTSLVTLEPLLDALDIWAVLSHWAKLSTFDHVLQEAGIWSDLEGESGYTSHLADDEVLEVHEYIGTWYMDHYYIVYKDPSMRLGDDWDIFYFNTSYLQRLFNTVASQMKAQGLKVIDYDSIPRLLIDTWSVKYPKRIELFEKFVRKLCIISGYGVGDHEIQADALKTKAGLEQARGGKFRLTD